MDDELERPSLPWWALVVVGVLALIGLVTVAGWVLGTIGGIVRLAVLALIVAVTALAVRGALRR